MSVDIGSIHKKKLKAKLFAVYGKGSIHKKISLFLAPTPTPN
jgi:hypothetical protein